MSRAARRARAGFVALTGTGAGASAVLAMLVLCAVFVAVAAPRSSVAFRTRALRRVLAQVPSAGRAVIGSVDDSQLSFAASPSGAPPGPVQPAQIAEIGGEIGGNLAGQGLPLRPPAARWWSATTSYATVGGAGRSAYNGSTPPQVEIIARNALDRFSRVVAGQWPAGDEIGPGGARFGVAVTRATAARFGLRVGSVLRVVAPSGPVRLVVTGIVAPVRPGSSFWNQDPNAAAATFNKTAQGGYWLGALFASQASVGDLQTVFGAGAITFTWEFPLALGGITADQAGSLGANLDRAVSRAGIITRSVASPTAIPLAAGVTGPLAQFVRTQADLQSLLTLLYVSLSIVGAVVLLLACRLLAERRAVEFSLIAARGAARPQLAWLAFRAGAIAVLPAAVLAAALAVVLTPAADVPLAWWLGGLTTAAALCAVPALAVRQVTAAGLTGRRTDAPPSRTVRARMAVTDLALVAAAAGGLVVLRAQGGASSGAADWYTSAAPVLVAVGVAVVVVRGYPWLVRQVLRLSGRGAGVTAFVGLARAVRTSAAAILPAFGLILVLGVVAFGATVRAAVLRGDLAASWQQAGADVVIDASGSYAPLSTSVQRAIAGVPGVRAVAAVSQISATGAGGAVLGVVVVNPARYAALVADTPLPAFPARPIAGPAGRPAALPVLASPGAVAALRPGGKLTFGSRTLRVRDAGVITSTPGVPESGPFVVMSAATAGRALGAAAAAPEVLLVAGSGIDQGRLSALARRLLPGSTVTVRARLLAALTSAPLPHGAYVTFALGSAAAAGFGIVIMAIMLALGARPRELTLARLFTMGLSPGQARRLVVAEALPVILAAAVGGAICAWLLVPLVGPAIDLAPFTGTSATVPVRADYLTIGLALVGLVVLALVTLFAQSATARLRGLGRALRVGE